MAAWWYAFVVLLFSGISVVVSGKCPCEDPSLCDTISRPPGKEFLMFSTKPNDWRKYDWGKVTTIALFRPWDDELMCEAHKRVSVGAIYLIDCSWSFLNLQKKQDKKLKEAFYQDKDLSGHVPRDMTGCDFICMEFSENLNITKRQNGSLTVTRLNTLRKLGFLLFDQLISFT